MNLAEWIGTVVFIAGLIIIGAYSIYPLFNLSVGEATLLFGMRLSIILMGIGAAIILVAMCFERYKDWKRMKEEISEEDLRP